MGDHFCGECGRRRADDAGFCMGCGRAFDAARAAPPEWRPWWAWPFTGQTALWASLVMASTLFAAALVVPITVDVPCSLTLGTLFGVTARVDSTCRYEWDRGLLGPLRVGVRPIGLSLR